MFCVRRRDGGMANEFEDSIIQDFARDIASRLGEAAAIARTADAYGKQGLAERAFQSVARSGAAAARRQDPAHRYRGGAPPRQRAADGG